MDKAKDGLYVDSAADIAFVRGEMYTWLMLTQDYVDIKISGELDYPAPEIMSLRYDMKPISKDLNTW